MRTVTTKTLVQMSEYCSLTTEQFETADGERLASALFFHPLVIDDGYTIVGEATITMTLHDKDKLIDAKVDSLKAQLQKTQADAEVACNRIREQINSLLALEYKPGVEA